VNYSGIDLHSNNSVVVVSDEANRVLVRRRVPMRRRFWRYWQRTGTSWSGWSLSRDGR
jgi:hypothetical protein